LTKDEKKLGKYGDDLKGYTVASTTPGIGDGSVVAERKVTDVLCLGIFGAFLIAMLTCTCLGFKYGDVAKLVAPIDSNHLICGHITKDKAGNLIGDATGYNYLYITNLATKNIFSSGWCVKACPKDANDQIDWMPVENKPTPEVTGGNYGTIKVLNYCIPVPSKLTTE
jgi:hypothetical protein